MGCALSLYRVVNAFVWDVLSRCIITHIEMFTIAFGFVYAGVGFCVGSVPELQQVKRGMFALYCFLVCQAY